MDLAQKGPGGPLMVAGVVAALAAASLLVSLLPWPAWSPALVAGLLAAPFVASVWHHRRSRRHADRAAALLAEMAVLRATARDGLEEAKASSARTLASGLGHEVNNPLFVIMGHAELLLMQPDRHVRTELARQCLATILEQGRVAAGAVESLRALAAGAAAGRAGGVSEVAGLAPKYGRPLAPGVVPREHAEAQDAALSGVGR